MTLLATLYNLGSMWPGTAVLYLIGLFTFKTCNERKMGLNNQQSSSFLLNGSLPMRGNKCSTPALSKVDSYMA
jgi:hypothetical protein